MSRRGGRGKRETVRGGQLQPGRGVRWRGNCRTDGSAAASEFGTRWPRVCFCKRLSARSQRISTNGFNENRSSEAQLGLRAAASALRLREGFQHFSSPFVFFLLLLFCISNAQQNFPCSERAAEQLTAGRRAESSNPPCAPDPPAANHPIKSPISAIMTAKRAETARKARGHGRQLIRVNQAARCLRRGVTAPETPRGQWARSHG